jgi:hypothetical protein
MRGDLTQGPILKTLLMFSIDALSNLLQTLNGTINSIWVGRLIGESALAATANVNIIMFLLMATCSVSAWRRPCAWASISARATWMRRALRLVPALAFASRSVLIGLIGSVLAPKLCI